MNDSETIDLLCELVTRLLLEVAPHHNQQMIADIDMTAIQERAERHVRGVMMKEPEKPKSRYEMEALAGAMVECNDTSWEVRYVCPGCQSHQVIRGALGKDARNNDAKGHDFLCRDCGAVFTIWFEEPPRVDWHREIK